MKCPVCNYVHEEEWENENGVKVGDERFIRINCIGRPFETNKCISECYSEYMNIYLYGCPKCQSVQFKEKIF